MGNVVIPEEPKSLEKRRSTMLPDDEKSPLKLLGLQTENSQNNSLKIDAKPKSVTEVKEKPKLQETQLKDIEEAKQEDELPNLDDPGVQNATIAIQKAYKQKLSLKKNNNQNPVKPADLIMEKEPNSSEADNCCHPN